MFRHSLIVLILLLSWTRSAAEFFVIEQFNVLIRVDPNGYFEVTETIDVRFSEKRHGIYRNIPNRWKVNGKKAKINLYDLSVEGWKFKTERGQGRISIRIGAPDKWVDNQQRYVIRYKVKDAWLLEEEHTEFYWNLIGNEWEVPIEKIDFRIELPNELTFNQDDYRFFSGEAGEQGTAFEVELRNGALIGNTTRTFRPGEGLTAAIRFPVDFIRRPSALETFMYRYGLASIPLTLLGFLGWLFLSHGKEDDFVEMVHFYPPDDLPPAEAGAFIDDKTDNRDIISLIPYWAGQGLLTIREVEKKTLLIFTDKDFEFNKKADLSPDRPDYEKIVFNRLFRNGDTVLISELKDKFHTTMSSARSKIQRKVRERQLYTPQSRLAWTIIPFGAILCILSAIPLFFFEQFVAAGGLLLAAIAGFILRRPMLKKNKEGMALFQKLYGFRMFVDKADRDRIERLLQEDPSYFEKTLPYAIAFGMAKKWAGNFEGLFMEPPNWYVGTHSYHNGGGGDAFTSFAGSFDSGMKEVQSVFTSAPSSSGSGGGGGGGFSGGGGGGGGGGSW